MRFTKMHGAGNDFIIINNLNAELSDAQLPRLAAKLCSAHTSIGADGLMVVSAAKEGGDYRMQFYNADGSMGEMCGNGARCIARYGYENGLAGETQRIETTAGIVKGRRISKRLYQVRLNDPSLIDLHRTVDIDGKIFDCAYVELGSPGIPHAVVLMDWECMDMDELRELGRKLRYSQEFPKGANVSFVCLKSENRLKAITFERGVEDFTLACGTGCGSMVSALTLLGKVQGEVSIEMPGGELFISLAAAGSAVRDIMLTGPTALICEGEILDEDLEI